jgi:hypothetical protein
MAHSSLLPPDVAPGTLTAGDFSAYVLSEITRVCGPQLPCPGAQDILNGFYERFGPDDGMAVVTRALGHGNGFWRNAPVTVSRFRESNDDYFARPLLEEAREAAGTRL